MFDWKDISGIPKTGERFLVRHTSYNPDYKSNIRCFDIVFWDSNLNKYTLIGDTNNHYHKDLSFFSEYAAINLDIDGVFLPWCFRIEDTSCLKYRMIVTYAKANSGSNVEDVLFKIQELVSKFETYHDAERQRIFYFSIPITNYSFLTSAPLNLASIVSVH